MSACRPTRQRNSSAQSAQENRCGAPYHRRAACARTRGIGNRPWYQPNEGESPRQLQGGAGAKSACSGYNCDGARQASRKAVVGKMVGIFFVSTLTITRPESPGSKIRACCIAFERQHTCLQLQAGTSVLKKLLNVLCTSICVRKERGSFRCF